MTPQEEVPAGGEGGEREQGGEEQEHRSALSALFTNSNCELWTTHCVNRQADSTHARHAQTRSLLSSARASAATNRVMLPGGQESQPFGTNQAPATCWQRNGGTWSAVLDTVIPNTVRNQQGPLPHAVAQRAKALGWPSHQASSRKQMTR